MISRILNLNFIYIISAVLFSVLVIFGYNKNSYLFNSGVEIIILNLIFIFVVINSYKDNVFLKFYLFYFYIFYLLNIFVVCLPGYDSYFILKEGTNELKVKYAKTRPDLFKEILTAAKYKVDPNGIMNPGVLIDPENKSIDNWLK